MRAHKDALKFAKIESAAAVVTLIVVQIVAAAVLWFALGHLDPWQRILAAVIPFLTYPVAFLAFAAQAPSAMAKEADVELSAAKSATANAAEKKAIRELLGSLLATASHLQTVLLDEQHAEAEATAMVDAWHSNVVALLGERLDASYVARFESDAGVNVHGEPQRAPSERRKGYWRWVHRRSTHLHQFIRELL